MIAMSCTARLTRSTERVCGVSCDAGAVLVDHIVLSHTDKCEKGVSLDLRSPPREATPIFISVESKQPDTGTGTGRLPPRRRRRRRRRGEGGETDSAGLREAFVVQQTLSAHCIPISQRFPFGFCDNTGHRAARQGGDVRGDERTNRQATHRLHIVCRFVASELV